MVDDLNALALRPVQRLLDLEYEAEHRLRLFIGGESVGLGAELRLSNDLTPLDGIGDRCWCCLGPLFPGTSPGGSCNLSLDVALCLSINEGKNRSKGVVLRV